jgi:hypothetical protein
MSDTKQCPHSDTLQFPLQPGPSWGPVKLRRIQEDLRTSVGAVDQALAEVRKAKKQALGCGCSICRTTVDCLEATEARLISQHSSHEAVLALLGALEAEGRLA